eukprot:gnl/MRDRNA2_/MRDRNA2_152678_c0_seq1.p1 gnl/MRDRNA2_/MRDRNA2_152678_c0~~gnl/MRDRNA2_/MRDRNA2_152678_c0_seq1.p1  ORF type:complete len:445 (-),score=62.29 gnl/MRDRNA2_/MRDRNA2_152678_c0_seq1:140-1390(-)
MPQVTFHVECETLLGEKVTIVGNHDILGSWNPARSQLFLVTDASSYPMWEGSCELPANHLLEFKLVVVHGESARWETIGKRILRVERADVQANMTFNTVGKSITRSNARSSGGEEVSCVCFHVHCETDLGEQVAIVGNHDFLGMWDPERSQVPLTTDAVSYPIWKGSCELPAGHFLEFKIVIRKGSTARWESIRKRTVSITNADMQLNMRFDTLGKEITFSKVISDLLSKFSKSMAILSFHVDCSTGHGEKVSIVGNHEILGMWDPERSQLSLTTDASQYPVWKGSCRLPAGHQLEFKIVVRDDAEARWETIRNRKVSITCADMQLNMKFDQLGKTYNDLDFLSGEALENGDIGALVVEDSRSLSVPDDDAILDAKFERGGQRSRIQAAHSFTSHPHVASVLKSLGKCCSWCESSS